LLGKIVYYFGIGLGVFFGIGGYIAFSWFASRVPNYPQQEFVVILATLFMAGAGFLIPIALKKSLDERKRRPPKVGHGPRRGWTEQEKERVRNRQHGRCNKCHRIPPRWEYHHRDGNRNNNSLRNCEGICPNCHSVKTHDE